MPQNKIDRRVRKTKKSIRNALLELIKKKSIKNISVREIADTADINRGTFYIHYKDVYDLVEQIENEMYVGFNKVLDEYKPEDIKKDPVPMITGIYSYLYDNSNICLSLLSRNGDITFLEQIKTVVKNRLFSDWIPDHLMKNFTKSADYEYFYSFLISGCTGLIHSWLETGMKDTPKYIAELTQRILTTDITMMQQGYKPTRK